MKYHHLNPKDGRWISRDPIGEKGGFNLYTIINNNTIYNYDLFGLAKQAKEKCEFLIFGGHAREIDKKEENFNKTILKTKCDKFFGESCFRSPDGGLVWPTAELRNERGNPSNSTIAELLILKIQEAKLKPSKNVIKKTPVANRYE